MEGKSLLEFIVALKENNNREWFHSNKDNYQAIKKDFEGFVKSLINGIGEFHAEIGNLEPKDCTFRINRDIRFSKDKSPYKTNFGAYFAEGGKKSIKAGYYIHIEPGASFIGGGLWMPPNEILSAVRQEIDYNQEEFKTIISNKNFKDLYPEFGGEKLKTCPKGYNSDHPLIDFLKLKSFIVSHNIDDKEIFKLTEAFVVGKVRPLMDLIQFLNRSF